MVALSHIKREGTYQDSLSFLSLFCQKTVICELPYATQKRTMVPSGRAPVSLSPSQTALKSIQPMAFFSDLVLKITFPFSSTIKIFFILLPPGLWPVHFQIFRIAHRTSTNTGTKITTNNKYFIFTPLTFDCESFIVGVQGFEAPHPLGLYQSSNLRIAAVIRPEIVPARMLTAKLSILLGRAVGFRLRRFLFAIALTSFLILVYYGCTVFSRWNIAQIYDLTFVHSTTVKPYRNVVKLFRVMIWYLTIKKRLEINGIQ